jgi:hypothetical protein
VSQSFGYIPKSKTHSFEKGIDPSMRAEPYTWLPPKHHTYPHCCIGGHVFNTQTLGPHSNHLEILYLQTSSFLIFKVPLNKFIDYSLHGFKII